MRLSSPLLHQRPAWLYREGYVSLHAKHRPCRQSTATSAAGIEIRPPWRRSWRRICVRGQVGIMSAPLWPGSDPSVRSGLDQEM